MSGFEHSCFLFFFFVFRGLCSGFRVSLGGGGLW